MSPSLHAHTQYTPGYRRHLRAVAESILVTLKPLEERNLPGDGGKHRLCSEFSSLKIKQPRVWLIPVVPDPREVEQESWRLGVGSQTKTFSETPPHVTNTKSNEI